MKSQIDGKNKKKLEPLFYGEFCALLIKRGLKISSSTSLHGTSVSVHTFSDYLIYDGEFLLPLDKLNLRPIYNSIDYGRKS